MTRQLIWSGGPWESVIGYSRAVREGNHVFVSGTTAANPDGTIAGGNDPYLQAKRCFEIIAQALAEAGASMRDVVRTRMFVTDIAQWPEFGRAHGEHFRDVRPVATMVQVVALLDPAMLVEIEVDAMIPV
ncbi:MAG: RidA family protein [Anaerolineaceae bacterium]